MKSVDKSTKAGVYCLSQVSSEYSLTRDAYYKFRRRFAKQETEKQKVISLVKQRRNTLPREGCRKLHNALEGAFAKNNLKIGRDKLFDILRAENMLIMRKKASFKTTNSYHHFHKYNNLIKDLDINQINQVWVSDITYIRTVNGFCYLALITDVYSRKIVGYDISDSLELSGCLRAFKRAQRAARPAAGLIHHSDRGVQYCSHAYVNELKKHGIQLSMTEENHCYENAIAERVNGILKDEFYLDQTFFNVEHAKRATKNAIKLYNEIRLHLSLNYRTPENVYKSIA